MKNTLALAFFAIMGVVLASTVLAGWNNSEVDLASIKVLAADEDIFETINNPKQSIIVDFYADWCGPCEVQSDILVEVASKLPDDTVRIIKVNVDNHSHLANQFQVRSIPALFVIKDGKVVDRHVGVATQEQVAKWLESP